MEDALKADIFPPRLFGGPDLIDEERQLGRWCAFEVKFKEGDTEYLSLAEHEAIARPLQAEIADLNQRITLGQRLSPYIEKEREHLIAQLTKAEAENAELHKAYDEQFREMRGMQAQLTKAEAAQKEFEESLRVAIKALSGVADTSPEVEAASMEVLNDTNECSEIWEANARRRRKIAIEALAHLAKAGHYLGEEK